MKAVIFDLDGVIIDSIPEYQTVWAALSRKYRFPFDLKDFNGMRTGMICNAIAAKQGLDARTLLRDRQSMERGIYGKIKFFRGANAAVRGLRNTMKVGLGSSAREKTVRALDARLSFLGWFDAWVSGDMVAKAKPWPDIFLEVSHRLGVRPRDCAVIEDAHNGILAAKSAGMKAVAVRNPLLSHEQEKDAHSVVEKISEVTPALINRLWSEKRLGNKHK